MKTTVTAAVAAVFVTGLAAVGAAAEKPAPATTSPGWPFDAAEAKRRQDAAAKELNLPVELSVDLGGGVKLDLVLIPAGEFLMGSPATELNRWPDTEPLHKVRLTKTFYLGKYELTQEQWVAVVGGKQPSSFQGKPDSAKRPVEKVSWKDATLGLLPKLNALAGPKLPASLQGWTFRLPTEAQWEYACRAGTATAFSCGDTITSDQANFNADRELVGQSPAGLNRKETTVVGSFKPNAWGLYDMHGNVWEWCSDQSGGLPDNLTITTDDPTGLAEKGDPNQLYRVYRGGGWINDARDSRSARRARSFPISSSRYNSMGLRLLLGP